MATSKRIEIWRANQCFIPIIKLFGNELQSKADLGLLRELENSQSLIVNRLIYAHGQEKMSVQT